MDAWMNVQNTVKLSLTWLTHLHPGNPLLCVKRKKKKKTGWKLVDNEAVW